MGSEPTGPQFAVLSAVLRCPEMDQRAAGLAASLDKSSTAEIVRRLVRNGWLTIVPDESDGRRKLLKVTRPAGAALKELTSAVGQVQRELLSPLDRRSAGRFVSDLALLAYEGFPPPPLPESSYLAAGLELSATPGYLLRRAQQMHTAQWATQFDGELTGPQYAVLCALAVNGGADQATIGEAAALDKSTVAEVVDRLIARQLVAAAPDPVDRRRKRLDLTADAVTELDRFTKVAQDVQANLMNFLPSAARARFLIDLAAVARYPS